jgi:transposase
VNRLGIRGFNPKLKKAAARALKACARSKTNQSRHTLAELRRDVERRRQLISDQIRQIEDARLERMPNDGPHAMVRPLARVIGVGIETADMLVQEVLSRTMRDRWAVPQCQATAAEFINGQTR